MPLPFKSKSAEPAAPANPPWHPNFRNYERLPDIKVVRTVFFVNAAAITVALACLAYVGFQEYSLYTLRNQAHLAEADIARDRKASDQAVVMYRKFKAEETKLDEVAAFLDSRPTVSPLLLHIAETLPRNVALSFFELRDKGLVIRGIVRGAPELASGLASSYVEQLHGDKVLSSQFDDVSLTSLNRNSQDGRLNFELFLRLKAPAKK